MDIKQQIKNLKEENRKLHRKIWKNEKMLKQLELDEFITNISQMYPNKSIGKVYLHIIDRDIVGFSLTEKSEELRFSDLNLDYDLFHVIIIYLDNQESLEISRDNQLITKKNLLKLRKDNEFPYNINELEK